MNDLRVLILAEDPLARAGLAAMLSVEDGLSVIGQASPSDENLAPFTHDIAVFDLGWEIGADLAALTASVILELETPLLILLPDSEFFGATVTELHSAPRKTAYGVLGRNAPSTMVLAALSSIYEGLITLDPTLVTGVVPIVSADPTLTPPTDPLTPREEDVLELLAEGLPNKIIARRLTISEYTVKFHVNSILSKLGAASRTEAVVRATRLGLITL